jgi:microcystin-dependent protein
MSTTGQIGNVDLSFLLPTGCLLPYAGSSAPIGFLLCDGSYYSTTTYAALFAVIGYTYGGSGSSFKIPDTRGIFVRGAGTQTIGSRTYSASLGTTNTDTTAPNGLFASTSVSISDPGHAHGINLSMNSGSGTHPVGGIDIPTTGNNTNVSTTGITATASTTLGGNSETSPAYTVVLYIIKT